LMVLIGPRSLGRIVVLFTVFSLLATVIMNAGAVEPVSEYPHGELIVDVDWSPDGTALCVASRNEMNIWDVDSNELIKTIDNIPLIMSVDWSLKNGLIAFGTMDNELHILDIEKDMVEKVADSDDWIDDVKWSPSGEYIGYIVLGDLYILETTDFEERYIVDLEDGISDFVWYGDDVIVSSHSYTDSSDTIEVWDLDKDSSKMQIDVDIEDITLNFDISEDERYLAVQSGKLDAANYIHIYNLKDEEEILKIRSADKFIVTLDFSDDSNYVLFCYANHFKVLDISRGGIVLDQQVGGMNDLVQACNWVPGSSAEFATGGGSMSDGSAHFWKVNDLKDRDPIETAGDDDDTSDDDDSDVADEEKKGDDSPGFGAVGLVVVLVVICLLGFGHKPSVYDLDPSFECNENDGHRSRRDCSPSEPGGFLTVGSVRRRR